MKSNHRGETMSETKCILCGVLTSGSIGAAGYHWDFLCQSCKDVEDKALKDMVDTHNKVTGAVLGKLVPDAPLCPKHQTKLQDLWGKGDLECEECFVESQNDDEFTGVAPEDRL
jgi:hypothetical protein